MFSRFSIQTRLSTVEVEEILRRLVRPKAAQDTRPFAGTVERGAFKFQRFIIHRNSFLPIISGRVVAGEGGAVVRGQMRLAAPVALFMTLWMGATISAAIYHMREHNVLAAIGVSGLPLFGALLIGLGFYPERHKALRLLTEALQPK